MYEPGNGTEPAVRVDDEWDYVEFWPAGVATSGWFLCAACGNAVIVRQVLPRCMLCGSACGNARGPRECRLREPSEILERGLLVGKMPELHGLNEAHRSQAP